MPSKTNPTDQSTDAPAAAATGFENPDRPAKLADRERWLSAAACRRRFQVLKTLIGDVRIRSLTERERAQFETDIVQDDQDLDRDRLLDAKRRLVVLTVCDADGNPVLSVDDVAALGEVDAAITGQVYDAARKLCGFESGDIERLAKNSLSVPADDSR